MIIFVNERNEIKDVNVTKDASLRPYEIAESDLNPFTNWPVAKICCYKVGLTPETVTEIVGTEDVTYTDLDENGELVEVTETREIKETRETGKYIITMMTPYVDSRIIEHIEQLGKQVETNSADILTTQDAVCESSMVAEERFLEVETALCETSMDTEERFAMSDERILEIETALCDLSMVMFSE